MNLLWLAELFRDSLRNLARHKLRTMLTLLGVMFGVASVITMLAIGEGAQRTVLREIASLGLTNIYVESVKPPDSSVQQPSGNTGNMLQYGITDRDVAQIRTACSDARISAAQRIGQKAYHGARRLDVDILGVKPAYFGYVEAKRVSGQLLSDIHEHKAHMVAVVADLAREIAGFQGALGQTIKIGRKYFEVIGVVAVPNRSPRDLLYIPHRTAVAAFGRTTFKREAGRFELTRTEVGQVVVQADQEEKVPALAEVVRHTMDANHQNADYEIMVPMDLLRAKRRTQRVLDLVLITIASISLLVGGIGIMNIMLATVMERVREIGIRRAVGARRRDIMLQFLCETLTLAGLGGILGCAVGLGVVPLASRWTGWAGIVTPWAIVVALVVSCIVGLVFGIAPAVRAARLNPVEALRSE